MKPSNRRHFSLKTTHASEETIYHRRRFLGVAAMSIAAAEFAIVGSADAQSSIMAWYRVPVLTIDTKHL